MSVVGMPITASGVVTSRPARRGDFLPPPTPQRREDDQQRQQHDQKRRLRGFAARSDHDGIAVAGDYIWRVPGSLHENHSPGGAVLFAVYRKPNIYYRAAKETAGF